MKKGFVLAGIILIIVSGFSILTGIHQDPKKKTPSHEQISVKPGDTIYDKDGNKIKVISSKKNQERPK